MSEWLQGLSTVLHYLVPGLGITVSVTLVALTIGFVIGTVMAVLRIYGGRFLSPVAALYSCDKPRRGAWSL
jgi:polar amino acid transport system permease protein